MALLKLIDLRLCRIPRNMIILIMSVLTVRIACLQILRFNTTAGNPIKKILLKLNLSDHRLFKDGGGGSLLSNTVTNPKEDLKRITTRSGVVYQGPTIPTTSSPRIVECRTEVTKDMVFLTNNGIIEDVQPPVVLVENQNPVSEPVVAPVSAPMPNQKLSIPYPSRRNDEKHRENANEQKEKFYEIFKDMSFEISFMDALTLMPKFA
ncbi:hypothetical protein Tco_0222284 [Tanacetum coccineum]